MNTRIAVLLISLALLFVGSPAGAGSPDVLVEALFPGSAVLNIDGQRKMLRAGQSHGGVTLVAADSQQATLRINGKTQAVGMSQRIVTNYEVPEERVVTIARDGLNQYHTTATIDGHTTRVLVDTGANVVAMSKTHAGALGVDYLAGTPSQVQTASGVSGAWEVTLRSVSIGGIQVDNVRAMVVDGTYPVNVLLGMSYLRHVKMQEHNGILSLSKAP